MNFLEDSNKFHQPPALPDDAKKSKSAFNRIVGRKGKYKNEYGRWKWNDAKSKPEIIWADDLLDEWEEDAMGGIYADLTDEELKNAQIMAQGKADAARTKDKENAKKAKEIQERLDRGQGL